MPHPLTSSTRACVVVVLITTAPVAEAANSRNSLCVPDQAPEAFITHDGKEIPASLVDNPVIIHLLFIGGLCRQSILMMSSPCGASCPWRPFYRCAPQRGQGTKGTNLSLGGASVAIWTGLPVLRIIPLPCITPSWASPIVVREPVRVYQCEGPQC